MLAQRITGIPVRELMDMSRAEVRSWVGAALDAESKLAKLIGK